jgi:methylmalonyl-CoA/ethylmalonyl-CoA epimerase
MSSVLGISGIGQLAINVKDTERATAFYRDVLGLKHLFSAGKLSFFECGGVRLVLSPAEKPELDHPSSIIYFKVSDLDGAHAGLKNKGAQIESEPHLVAKMPDHELWMSFFHDSEGNLLSLMCEKR